MIIVGADHAGHASKEHAKKWLLKHHSVLDVKPDFEEGDDYVDVAKKAIKELKPRSKIILFCGSGSGMAIAANRYKGIRAVVAHDVATAKLARAHNNANVLALSGRTGSDAVRKKIIQAFLTTSFQGGRHARRIKKLEAL